MDQPSLFMEFNKAVIILSFVSSLLGQTIPTDDVDNNRNNWNASETKLTPANVKAGIFGKIGSYTVDGYVYARPLYIPSVVIGGKSHNLLIIATMHCSVYAFDADLPGSTPLWHAGPLCTSRTVYPDGNTQFFYFQEVSCTETPVIDVTNGFIYEACTSNVPAWTLYKLNLSTGATSASVVISGSVIGTGDSTGPTPDSTTGANLNFYPDFEIERAGLTLANGNVYTAWASWGDVHPWHGWVIAYNASTLSQTGIVCITPNDYGGGIWHASGGLAVDGGGNVYAGTGNGGYDGVTSFANSMIKMNGTSLAITDWYTPTDWMNMEAGDWDVSSGRMMLIPGTSLGVIGEKDFNVYSVNTTCMGHLGGTVGCTAPQVFPTNAGGSPGAGTGIYGGMYMNGIGYFPNVAGSLYAFALSGSTWNTTATTSAVTSAFPGVQISGSSNGASNGIVWGLSMQTSAFRQSSLGTLRAFNPTTLVELWNSDTNMGDALGVVTKFNAPLIANGRVFVSTLNSITVFGLRTPAQMDGQVTINGSVVIH